MKGALRMPPTERITWQHSQLHWSLLKAEVAENRLVRMPSGIKKRAPFSFLFSLCELQKFEINQTIDLIEEL